MHAMWICPANKNRIGGGKERKTKIKKKRKGERKKERKEDLTASSFEFSVSTVEVRQAKS